MPNFAKNEANGVLINDRLKMENRRCQSGWEAGIRNPRFS